MQHNLLEVSSMYGRLLLAGVLALVLALALTSCAREEEADVVVDQLPEEVEAVPPEAVAPEESAEDAGEPAAEMDQDAVVEEVGAPIYEGATFKEIKTEDGKIKATFTTPAAYADVKAYYMEQLKAPDWSNNGFEAGAMGGDEWEWKNAESTKFLMVKRDTDASETEIRFTLKQDQ
jgi:hypothetical protein